MQSAGEFRLYDVTSDRTVSLRERLTVTAADGAPLFVVEPEGGGWCVARLDGTPALSLNQHEVRRRADLEHLSIIQAGEQVFIFLERDDPVVSTNYSANLWLVNKLDEALEPTQDPRILTKTLSQTIEIPLDQIEQETVAPRLPGTIQLADQRMLIGRDQRRVAVCLPDVRVSCVHAAIQLQGSGAVLTDLKSTNGTFVDGEQIRGSREIFNGSRIQIGPYTLIFRGGMLHPLSHDNNVQLTARDLIRRVPDRGQRGATKVILDGISLVIHPREFVCILGPSGSGKTTLLSALSARVPADEGTVFLNDQDLYTEFELLKQNLAVVPQKDVLHDVLPLSAALWYTAKLRLPADMSAEDIEQRIDTTLDTVNLVQRQYAPIRKLSGGQVKRASWANEAICNPSLIFLDEVTSGLDEQTDSEMMQLFRRMADEGKTIVCVTHSLSYVEQNCNLLVILAPGGVLAFVGSPSEALEYFGVSRLGDVYQKISQHEPQDWKGRFRAHPLHEKYVEGRLPPVDRGPREKKRVNRWGGKELLTAWRQFVLLLRRNSAIQLADKRALAMMFGQSLFIAGLLVWLFGDISALNAKDEAVRLMELTAPGIGWEDLFPETQEEYLSEAEEAKRMDRSSKLLFLLCISCIWFGCNNSAKEIIKERTIYSKERDVGLRVPSYYASKLVLLGILTAAQASLLYLIVDYFTCLGGSFADQWLLLSLTALTGVAMGLAISALASSEDVAVTIVPMALIPQIIMAGLIAPLLNHTREFSQICIPAYWSYQGLLQSLDEPLRDRLREADYLVVGSDWTMGPVSGILATYIGVFAVVALAALYSRDR